MAVCQFFLRGQCRFGDQCRNEHPKNTAPQGHGTFGNQTWTAPGSTAGQNSPNSKITFSADTIKKDLTDGDDKPSWPLSSYGPSKAEPTLITGLDESPEELRFMAWQALKSGDAGQIEAYKTYEQAKIAAAEVAHRNGRDLSEVAFQAAYRVAAAPPSVSQSTTASGPHAPSAAGFGQRSAFGQPASTSAFGQPSQTVSAFGQPSKATSAFGQTAFGQAKTSAFGQPVQPASSSAFGQPTNSTSAFGQSAFGQPVQPTATFGQPSLSQGAQPSAFGQPAFGQQSKPSAFGQPAFGQASQPPSAFAQPTPAFGQTSQPTSAFGLPAKPQTSVFGQPSKAVSAFGQPTQPPALGIAGSAPSAFGGASASGGTGNNISEGFGAFANAGKPSAFAAPSNQSAFGPSGAGSAFGGAAAAPAATKSAFGTGGTGSAFGAGGSGSALGLDTGTGPAPSSLGTTTPSTFAPLPSTASSSFGTLQMPQPASTAPSQLDFVPKGSLFDPAADPYTVKLPPNYLETIPKHVREAFESREFEWKNVPEWIPPVELR